MVVLASDHQNFVECQGSSNQKAISWVQPRRLHLLALQDSGAHLSCKFPLMQGVEPELGSSRSREIVETFFKHMISTHRNGAALTEGMMGKGLGVDWYRQQVTCAILLCPHRSPWVPSSTHDVSNIVAKEINVFRVGPDVQWHLSSPRIACVTAWLQNVTPHMANVNGLFSKAACWSRQNVCLESKDLGSNLDSNTY